MTQKARFASHEQSPVDVADDSSYATRMDMPDTFEIFLVTAPGLEDALAQEARETGFDVTGTIPGGVTLVGGWPEVSRANLELRGPARVLARFGEFRAFHLAQLDKRSRKFPWSTVLRPDVPVRVDVTCKQSKIYHAGAAKQRIETAITEELGAPISPVASLQIKVRIDDNLCTFSVDTSGEPLHRRGHKEAVGKAPMRENMAALFLRECGYDGQEPVLDPMCGSGTFVLEAAEWAAGLKPGRSRSFAFEKLASFDSDVWERQRSTEATAPPDIRFTGSDRDAGAIEMSRANAARAGVEGITSFQQQAVANLERPDGPTGLVMVNPPYGARIGNRKLLFALYAALGRTLKERFSGWRVGLVTSDAQLARATDLPFGPAGPHVPHGGLKVRLFNTTPLP